MRRATLYLYLLILGARGGESKINKFDQVIAGFIHQYIVKLQIPMHNANAVHECHSVYYLVENPGCLTLRQSLQRPSLYVMVKILTLAKLHDEMHLCSCINHLIETHYVLVAHVCQHVDLSMEGGGSLLLLQVTLFVSFDSQNVTCVAVGTPLDHGIGTCSKFETDIKVVN